MTQSSTSAFESTIHTTNIWINDLLEDLGWEDPEQGYHALRAVLHVLRDHLQPNEAADLAAQLPMLVRGFYYEGWKPEGRPVAERKKDQFLAHVRKAFNYDPRINPEAVTRAVFRTLARHISKGEIEDVIGNLPADLREMW